MVSIWRSISRCWSGARFMGGIRWSGPSWWARAPGLATERLALRLDAAWLSGAACPRRAHAARPATRHGPARSVIAEATKCHAVRCYSARPQDDDPMNVAVQA